jgi:site-specific DNA recombinase
MARTHLPRAPLNTYSGYVRLSREALESNLSRDGMMDDIRALAASKGLKMVAEHIDDGYSGAIRNRPEFMAWLDDGRQGRVDHLIAWHVDRMTREGVNVAGIILDVVEGKDPVTGAKIREPLTLLDTKGLDSGDDDSSFRFRFVIAAEVARGERGRMKDRSKNSRRRTVAAGRWPGGTPAFGFTVVDNPDGAGKVLALAATEAEMLKEIAARMLAGASLASCTRYANSPAGVAPRRAPFWFGQTLRQCLTGAAVRGPILSPDESAALRRLLIPVPGTVAPRRASPRLLGGLVSCHSCQEIMAVGSSRGVFLYRCHTRMNRTCAAPVSISALPLEAYISERFLGQYGDKAHVIRRAGVAGAADVEFAEDAVEEALAALRLEATEESFKALGAAQERLKTAQEIPAETMTYLEDTGLTIAEVWESSCLLDRRDILAANIAAIIVRPGQRGQHGVDVNRVAILDRPPHAGEAMSPSELKPGKIVV